MANGIKSDAVRCNSVIGIGAGDRSAIAGSLAKLLAD